MAGGSGFGGFGGSGGGFWSANFHAHHHPFHRSTPPLTAIDRFLVRQSPFSQRQQTQNSGRNGENEVSGNGFHDFFSGSGAIVSCGSGVSWQPLEVGEEEEDGLNLQEKKIPEVCEGGEGKVAKKSSRGSSGKRVKGGSSATLIKGQWSAEEDR